MIPVVYWVLGGIVVAMILGYGLLLYLQSRTIVDTAPKDDMFICQVHGAMPKAAMHWIDPDGMAYEDRDSGRPISDAKIPYCPICFEARIKEAGKQHGI